MHLRTITLLSALMLTLAACQSSAKTSESDSETESVSETTSYTPKDLIDVDPFDRTYTKLESESLYVNKVENLTDQNYIIGMDASSVIAEENSGVVYHDFDGNEADVFQVLSDAGVNYIRVRIWNDPYDDEGHGYGGGNNDLATAIAIGKRATQYQMSLLVDFHYSDFWADPNKQYAPKAWQSYVDDYDYDSLADAFYDYTKESLQALVDAGVTVGMVQLGNENNGGAIAGVANFNYYVKFVSRAAEACREVVPDALIALHFTNPEKSDNLLNYANRVKSIDYDVFGCSYYPYWHGTLENLSTTLSTIAETYDKYVMILETSYAYTTEDTDFNGNTISEGSGYDYKNYPFTVSGQNHSFRDVVDTIVNDTTNGLGVCYWEGTWISVGTNSWEENYEKWETYGSGWASSYSVQYDPYDAGLYYGGCAVDNQALFDAQGYPLESLKAFNLIRFGNETDIVVDGVEDVEVTHYDSETFTLPETVNAIFTDNHREEISVEWEDFDIEAAKANGNAKYTITGVAGGFTVYCKLIILEYNYVENYSFETVDGDGNAEPWVRTTDDTLSSTHIIKVTSENPQTGTYAWHFWTSDSGGLSFDLTQTFTSLDAGTYKMQASILGGGASGALDASSQNNYIYYMIDGVEGGRTAHTIGSYNDGYQDVFLTGIELAAGQTLTIGVHISSTAQGCWGDIDDVMLNKNKA